METQGQQQIVNFSIEIRQSTSVQKEAGKRLFKSLIARAENTAKARAQAVAGAPPAVSNQSFEAQGNPPSLTNRGDSTYRC
jgi:L-amino acid N-acyltransferase YncA